MVDGVGGAVGSFQIGLESALPAPSNDTICGALPLTVDGPYDNNDNGYALGSDNDDIKATNAGFEFTVTLIEVLPLQPAVLTFNKYKPEAIACALVIVGFWTDEVNPLGPDQLYVLAVDANKNTLLPAQ